MTTQASHNAQMGSRLKSLSIVEETTDPGGAAPEAGRAPRRRGSALLLGGGLAVLALGGAVGLGASFWPLHRGAVVPAAQGTARVAQSVPAEATSAPAAAPTRAILGSGYSRATRDVNLTTVAIGQIATVHIHEGEDVAAGTPLVTLDDRVTREALRQAEIARESAGLELKAAQLSLAQQNVNTDVERKLVARGAAPKQSLTAAEQALAQRRMDVARAAIKVKQVAAARDAARLQLSREVLRAPFGGRITDLTAQVGEIVRDAKGISLLRLFDPSSIVVDVDVLDRDPGRLRPGMAAAVTFDAWPDRSFAGTVTRIGSTVAKDRGTITVEITLNELVADLRPNMAARAILTRRKSPKIQGDGHG